uniref:hypothetical protein n=1 Tax=uncultured Psychrobacter sp. TaxID=259303 RepID=UPI0026301EC8
RYLSLLGQAICTEAAAREIRAGASESQRRKKVSLQLAILIPISNQILPMLKMLTMRSKPI